ncbi:MAG: hypothetical protein HY423_13360 [Candidatus Lambdaproteobacteria bacterium]|nr:hypothetical protein [Candidatus Lambdaproteobacteria bacterium]
MTPGARAWAALSGALLLAASLAQAADLQPGINAGSIIDFPTALDQRLPNMVHGSIVLFDLGEPDIRASNLRYGVQLGNLQLLGELNFATAPKREFDYGELKAKLRLLNFEPQRTFVAVGALGRYVDGSGERGRVDDRLASLLAVVTTELLPFKNWSGILVNFYLDNRFADLGVKFQVYPSIRAVGELDYLHSTSADERLAGKAGIEIEGEQNFYFQLFYSGRDRHAVVQVGSGF